ncbi:MAG: xanthine dehydrogenase family protein molybdopterin-binding subunit, partial [Gemmatimonadales bacterium]
AVQWDDGPSASLSSAGISATFARLAEQPGVVARTEGDAAAALAAAAKRVEAVYEVPYLHHATMEPMNATAHVRADGCDIWAPTQNQSRAQGVAAELTGLPPEKVRIHTTYLGGGFGRRLESDFIAEAVRLSQETGAPVKVIWSREDDVRHGFYRPATYNRFAAGLDAGGRPVAWTHRIVAPSILLPKFGALREGIDGTLVEGAANLPYHIANLRVEQTVADIPVPLGFWRSVGSSQNAFVTECFFDEVAAAAGRDPYELRRELLRAHPRHLGALELAARKAGWGKPLPPGRGRGIAVAESFGSYVAQVAEVSVGSDGAVRVHRVVCAVDCGPVASLGQIEAQMEGGIVYGLTAALYGEITIERGRVQQSNFHDYPLLRHPEMPAVETYVVPSTESQGGIGEPSVPLTAPAVCNAIFAATGKRIRKLPIRL